MSSEAAVAEVIQVLEATNTPYMVVGAFSSNAYGIGRATKDADFVIKADSPRVIEIARRLGPDYHLQRQMQLETITGSVRNIIKYSPTDFDIELFRLTNDDHHQSRFARRVRRSIPSINCEAWIPTAEDVIIQKLRWGRRKDLDDVVNVLSVSGETLDNEYLLHWTDMHGTSELLQQLRDELGS